MNPLGIYFGPKAITIIETKARSIINSAQIPQTTISTGELEEKVPVEVKTIGIVALFKEELRKNKIAAKEATLCLSGKDLIIRTFEMPAMPREELQSAINFEVKKYIPFKVEDLISDFQILFNKPSRSNIVLFMGTKKETLDKYISIFNQLNIKIRTIEYSAFSILRCLKLSGLGYKGIIGILGVDLKGGDEANFTVLENGFPLFSRDIVLNGGAQGEREGIEELGSDRALEKLKTEIRVSLDYYHRKFPAKNTKKIFLISSPDSRSDLEAIMAEIGLTTQFIDISRQMGRAVPYSLVFIKSYGAALSKTIKTDLKLNLLAAKEKARFLKAKPIQLGAVSLVRGLRLDYRVLVSGLFICIATFVFNIYRTIPLQKELNRVMGMHPQVAALSADSTYEELSTVASQLQKKVNGLDALVKKQIYLTEPLDIIPRVMPKGAWLINLSFAKREESKAELVLEGMVYLGDDNREFLAVNQFISDLKGNPRFNKYFNNITIVSLGRRQIEKINATEFYISCKTY